jgi:hypothetical protein
VTGTECGEKECICGQGHLDPWDSSPSGCPLASRAVLAIEQGHRTGLTEGQAAQSPFAVFLLS